MVNRQAGKGDKSRPCFISREERDLRYILATNSKLNKQMREDIISAINSKDINIMMKVLNNI
ncbi:MAG: hypothetical protein D4S01_05435 [Dehalococcoidia bacterium]|nr:MAG: hypothetical protein D4S01_05435 [Dehalococcoidia bacterium]